MAAPIFVRGTGRCGSKTLARLIGEHPQVSRVPANQCLPEELLDFNDFHVRRRIPMATAEALAAGCRAYFEAYARELVHPDASPHSRLLHKSTANTHRLDDLLDLWPDTRIVYIVRHPLDVVPAMVSVDIVHYRGRYGYDANVVTSLLRWANDVHAFLRSRAATDPRVRLVRFEAMIDDTDRFFAELDEFLDLDPGVRRETGGPVGYDDEFVPDADERQWILDATRDLLTRLGYTPDDRNAEVPPELAGRTRLHADRRPSGRPPSLDGAELLRRALRAADDDGRRRVALFGAGYLTRLALPHLQGDKPVAILDEHPMLAGGVIAGVPIERPQHAASLGIDAVIPATFVHQRALAERWLRIAGPGIPVVPLWDERGAILAV